MQNPTHLDEKLKQVSLLPTGPGDVGRLLRAPDDSPYEVSHLALFSIGVKLHNSAGAGRLETGKTAKAAT